MERSNTWILCLLLFIFQFSWSTAANTSSNIKSLTPKNYNTCSIFQSATLLFKTKKSLVPIITAVAASFSLSEPCQALDSFKVFPTSVLISDSAITSSNEITTDDTVRNVVLPSGVSYFDVKVGEGDVVQEGKSVQFFWVLRRSNGYFVASNAQSEPFIYKVGNIKKVIKGLDEAIRGMKAGGIRRIAIPPKLAFVEGVDDGKPGPIPDGFGPKRQILTRLDKEVWYFEIKLLKVK